MTRRDGGAALSFCFGLFLLARVLESRPRILTVAVPRAVRPVPSFTTKERVCVLSDAEGVPRNRPRSGFDDLLTCNPPPAMRTVRGASNPSGRVML